MSNVKCFLSAANQRIKKDKSKSDRYNLSNLSKTYSIENLYHITRKND